MSFSKTESWLGKLPLGYNVTVLKADPNGLLALDKPVDIQSHPNSEKPSDKALLRAAYDFKGQFFHWKDEEGEERKVWLLNRLDAATSGVILCASDATLAERVKEEFASNRVNKTYHALLFGSLSPPRQVWRDALAVKRQGGRLRTTAGAGAALRAETFVRQERKFFSPGLEISLVELNPKTGRTHQLRVQCAKRKLPIVGDRTYGGFRANREFAKKTGNKRLFLHSTQTKLRYRYEGKHWDFHAESPLPDEFRSIR